MRFPKLLPLMFLLTASSVFAQSVALSGLSKVGASIGGVFSGIFDGISGNPAVWMKVILIIILYIIFQMLVVGKLLGADQSHPKKGAVTTLSLVLAIGMVAPVPSSIIVALFTGLQFMGLVFYVAPVFGIMIWAHKMTAKDAQGNEPARSYFAMALILWILTLFGYINGLGFATDVPNVDLAAGILNFVAIIAIIYYTMKLITVSGSHSMSQDRWGNLFGGGSNPTPPGTPPSTPPGSPSQPGFFSRLLGGKTPEEKEAAVQQTAQAATNMAGAVFSSFDRSINALAGALSNVQSSADAGNVRAAQSQLRPVFSTLEAINGLEKEHQVLVRIDPSKTLARDLAMQHSALEGFMTQNLDKLDVKGTNEFTEKLKLFYGSNGLLSGFITNFKAMVTKESVLQAFAVRLGIGARIFGSRVSSRENPAGQIGSEAEERVLEEKNAVLNDLRMAERGLLSLQKAYLDRRNAGRLHDDAVTMLGPSFRTLVSSFASLLNEDHQALREKYLKSNTRETLQQLLRFASLFQRDVLNQKPISVQRFMEFFAPNGVMQSWLTVAIDELGIALSTRLKNLFSDIFGPTFSRLDQINAFWMQSVGNADLSRQSVRANYVQAFVRTNAVAIKTILGELNGYRIDWNMGKVADIRVSRNYVVGKLSELKPFLEKIDADLAQKCGQLINTFKNASSKGELVMAGQVYESFLPRVSVMFANAGLAA